MAYKPVMSIIAAKAALDATTALVGSGPGNVEIFASGGGGQPATTLTADAGTKLSTLPMSSTAFTASTSTTAAASGVADYFRIKTATGGTTIYQGNVGTSGCDLNMNTTTINSGDTVAITSHKLTLPCGDGTS